MSNEQSKPEELSAKQAHRLERKQQQAARRRRLILFALGAFLLAAACVGGRHAYHWAKARRADQFASEGDALASADKYNEAADKYRAALQLDPLGYHALRGAAQLATRVRRPEATDLWAEVMKLSQATNSDREEYATLLVSLGRFKVAQPILDKLLQENPDTKTLNLAATYARSTGDNVKALEFARLAVKRAPQDNLAKFGLADLLADSTDASSRGEARQLLWEIAGTSGPYQEAALEGLAKAPELSREEQDRLLGMLETNKTPTLKSALFAADLKLQLHPEEAARIYDQTIARWNQSDNPGLLDLARWLNLHLQGERVLALYSLDRALQDNQLLLSRLDALANLQRWTEIDDLLGRPDLTLDPSVLESFRARAAQERNASLDAEVHWNHALSLAANDPYKLRFVANFAEQSHKNAVALKAYEQLARIPEQAMLAYRATQRLSAQGGDLTVQKAAAEKIATQAPQDPNAAAQVIYLNLLAGTQVEANFEAAKKLVEKYPDRLSFRVTAALGYLRQHDPGLALAQFKGPAIEWKKTPPAWQAVYAAVLMANEQSQQAKDLIVTIPKDKLTPEERALIGAKGD